MSTANFTRARFTAFGTKAVPGLLAGIRLALRDWQSRRATVVILASLDQRTLHDIGMDRHEIDSVVYGGRDRRRSYDAEWRRPRGRA
jgi:uncharacterized protein YjiS (DUF1127 family)